MDDPYKTLGLKRGATDEEAKKAYKRLAMKYHPDRNQDDPKVAEEKFKKVKQAYEDIQDGVSYYKAPNFDFGVNGGDDIYDFIKKAKAKQRQQQFQYSVSVVISLKDAVQGGKQIIRMPINGQNETFEVVIPAGVQDTETIRYPKVARGSDLVITYTIKENDIWEVEGRNLIRGYEVSIWDLINGCTMDVTLIDDSVLRMKIPAGTQPNTFMRIKGKGIPTRSPYGMPADVLVRLDAKIPDSISAELLELIHKESYK